MSGAMRGGICEAIDAFGHSVAVAQGAQAAPDLVI
jgi:hypothetical protein